MKRKTVAELDAAFHEAVDDYLGDVPVAGANP